MKIKIIDLLNKIANGETAPIAIKYNSTIYYRKGNGVCNEIYYCSDDDDYEFSKYININILNDEIELIEEEKKIELPEELKEILIPIILSDSDDFTFICNYINDLIANQNQIIDYLKYKEEVEE